MHLHTLSVQSSPPRNTTDCRHQAADHPAAGQTTTTGRRTGRRRGRHRPGRPRQVVFFIASREAALTLPVTFVPVDHAIVGIVDDVSTSVDW